ncbi:MAG: cobyrinate a,c-diamide synthase [Methanoregula sp.]|jgi:cobyrinic acid a,c-diamide synthase
MSIPRIVIAGTWSGCGKTTIASGIMGALIARGLAVQPFKVGPDFIDPSHHTRICCRKSRNLDSFMMGEEGVRETFERACTGADIAVIEGVMGLFDGLEGSDIASTAHVARILDAPVILVVDVQGMSRSANALIGGYRSFDPSINIVGVIFNQVGSPRHRAMIETSLVVPASGWIPRQKEIAVKSRHLGLLMADEAGEMDGAAKLVEKFCCIDDIIAHAQQSTGKKILFSGIPGEYPCNPPAKVRIGVALDRAFCFYYEDNFDRLRNEGAELVFFSPLKGECPDVDAVYLGGGYPELYAEVLESSPFTKKIRADAENDMPVYAECGGLMYLSREITAEKTFRMAGILPADAEMTKRIQALGYVKGQCIAGSPPVAGSGEITGHEFHYSQILPDRDAHYAFRLSRGRGISEGFDGVYTGNTLGSYTHRYFSDTFARAFIHAAIRYRDH